MTASKQLLVNFTSTSGSLNFGMIIIQHLSNLVLNMLVDSACTTPLGRLFHKLTTLLVKKNVRRSYFVCLRLDHISYISSAKRLVALQFKPRSWRLVRPLKYLRSVDAAVMYWAVDTTGLIITSGTCCGQEARSVNDTSGGRSGTQSYRWMADQTCVDPV